MYKSRLQELCQLRQWPLPTYTPLKSGPDHNPTFTATVTVNGSPYTTTEPNRNSKEAQNSAAKLAFDKLSVVAPPVVHVTPPLMTRLPTEAQDNAAKIAFENLTGNLHAAPVVVHVAPSLGSAPMDRLPTGLIGGSSTSVNGSPAELTSKKFTEAQDNAAKIAFENLTGNLHATPVVVHVAPSLGAAPMARLPTGLIGGSSTSVNGSPAELTSKKFTDSAHIYKNRLQNYALKKNLPLPAYSCEREGPPHAPRFRCKVTFQGKTSEVSDFYSTIKEAEHAAAKNAWDSWSLDEVQQDDTALYKNLLQEYLQRKGCPVPKYETTISGLSHMPNFVSKVNINGHIYEGQAALSKKQAESHVAKVAYFGLQDTSNSNPAEELNEAGNNILCIGQHIETHAEELNEAGNNTFCIGQHIETQPVLTTINLTSQMLTSNSNTTEELNEAGNNTFCIGQHIETQPGFSSGYRIKEALEVSSSILQSVIAKEADLPVKLTPYANYHIPAELSEEYAANTDEAPPLSPETDNGAKRLCLPSSDLFDFNSSTFSSIESNNVHQQVGSTDTKTTTDETVVVRPFVPNMIHPAGACILPFSDDKWVAVKMNLKS